MMNGESFILKHSKIFDSNSMEKFAYKLDKLANEAILEIAVSCGNTHLLNRNFQSKSQIFGKPKKTKFLDI
jgi:hypothetical protein